MLHITPLCSLLHTLKGQVPVFAGQVKIVNHLSCRTSAILKYILSPEIRKDVTKFVVYCSRDWSFKD